MTRVDISLIDYYYDILADGTSINTPSINVLSQQGFQGSPSTPSINIQAVAEIGLSQGFFNLYINTHMGYTSANNSPSATYEGLSDVDVLEVLLWQSSMVYSNTSINVTPVKDPIAGLETEHLDSEGQPMAAIGIRCTSSSVMGNAKIDGLTSTFSNFVREDPMSQALDVSGEVARLGFGVPAMLLQGNTTEAVGLTLYPVLEYSPILDNYTRDYSVVSTGVNWLQPLFAAGGIQTDLLADTEGIITYSSCMQTDDLQSAVGGVYAQYALQLMFSGQEFDTWINTELTTAVPWPIIVGAGGVPPLLVLICLSVWALGCLVLGVVYGTIKRWGETFGGYSFLRYCKDVLKCDPDLILENA